MGMEKLQNGFSIVELMIALALGMLMMLGILQVFDANKRTGNLTNGYARVQENGRMATEMLVRDIRMADAWGCAAINSGDILNHLDSNHANFKPYMDFTGAPGINGLDDVPAGTNVGTYAVVPKSDLLILRGAKPLSNVRLVSPYMVVNDASIHINLDIDIPLGTLLMISDCNGADVFSNTSSDTTKGTLTHDTESISADASVPNSIKNLSHTYGANAQLLRPFMTTYFVGPNDAGGSSLFRQDNGQTFELVRDVTDLQIVYGEDTGVDGSADKYSNASAANMDNVVSIRASLETQSQNPITDKGPLTRTYSVTTNIRNRSL